MKTPPSQIMDVLQLLLKEDEAEMNNDLHRQISLGVERRKLVNQHRNQIEWALHAWMADIQSANIRRMTQINAQQHTLATHDTGMLVSNAHARRDVTKTVVAFTGSHKLDVKEKAPTAMDKGLEKTGY